MGEICEKFNLPERNAEAFLAVLCSLDFLQKRNGLYHVQDVARLYLVKGGEFYWGDMLTGRGMADATQAMLASLRNDNRGPDARVTRVWEAGQMSREEAEGGNRRMHSHSMPAAIGVARNGDFAGVKRLLDVAGGSGCYAIAIARQHPEIHCSVGELEAVVGDTQKYLDRYGVADRVGTYTFNMFQDPWPKDYDAMFFSNVFHDWEASHRFDLAQSCFDALQPGGTIYLHEMLLNDSNDGPTTAALFSLLMMVGTRGKQFSGHELEELLTSVGFTDLKIKQTYGYYSLVSARKPG
jgi:acetylserotonin N-methyltransferase